MRQQIAFPEWERDRYSMEESLNLTAESLCNYGKRYRHWGAAFSGGKDSSLMVTVLYHLLKTGRVPMPESLTVLYADTRLEMPPLQQSAMQILRKLQAEGIQTRVVLPTLDDRFFVYMLGRGVPPPKNRFRWCTSQLKVEPMLHAMQSVREQTGEKILMLTGVRMGESAIRDTRIVTSCSRDGAECGQGWFQTTAHDAVADTLAPVLHWRLCHVWDWLSYFARKDGFDTQLLAYVYGDGQNEGDTFEVNARTGCVGCNLASDDQTLKRLTKTDNGKYSYLRPLLNLRSIYAEMQLSSNRLRKNGEVKKDGTPSSNQGRLGPLTLNVRKRFLAKILEIQEQVNLSALESGMPIIDLINAEELKRINDLIAAKTYPRKWDGTEMTGDTLLPLMYTRGGGKQCVMVEIGNEALRA